MVFRCTRTAKLGLAMTDYMQSVIENARECIQKRGRSFIIDRHWPSSIVYARACRRKMEITTDDVDHFIREIKMLGGVYVFCSDDIKTQIRRHAENRDAAHPYDDQLYERICGEYFSWWGARVGELPIRRYQILQHGHNIGIFLHDLLSDADNRAV